MENATQIPEPAISRFLFADTRAAWFWLIIRLYVAYAWFSAGYEKFINPNWIGDNAGTAIKGFFMGTLAKAAGDHPQVSSWYASFVSNYAMPNAVMFSYVITFGQLLVAAGLFVGLFTGIAAFFGSVMNLNFLLAGAVSTNPVLLLLQLFLILAWRNAGWVGLDRYALPMVGVPWQAGDLFKKNNY